MLEPNDIAFRLLCRKAGCGLTYTGMTNVLSKQEIHLDDKPCLQIFSSTPDGIEEFMKKYEARVSMFDFNLGCPSKLSKKLAHGAFMHRDFDNLEAIFKTMRESTCKPISIKLRKSSQALDIAKMACKYVDAIAIHPRTSEQGYSGEADYSFALELKKIVDVPVIYSGDVTVEKIPGILEDFDFVFIGRGAVGNPGVFSLINGEDSGISFRDYVDLAKEYEIYFRNIKYHAMSFTKGIRGSRKVRMNMIKSRSIEDIEKVMCEIDV